MNQLLVQMNRVYALLDELATDGDPTDPATLELALRRDATRDAIDALVARGLADVSAQIAAADVELEKSTIDLWKATATDQKIERALAAGAQVIAIAAQIVAKIV